MIQLYGVYNYELCSDVAGFIDCDSYNYVISLKIDNSNNCKCFDNICLDEFKNFHSVKDCVDILCSLVRQCFWSDIEFINNIRAKIKLSGASGNQIDLFIAKEVDRFLDSLTYSNIRDFTFRVIWDVCKKAKQIDLKPN